MYVDVKFYCKCGAVAVKEVELEERRSESSCGCCPGNGSGEFYIPNPSPPDGWRRDRSRYDSTACLCPNC